MASSSLYQTAPVGGPGGQPDYLNAVIALRPKTSRPEELLRQLLELEAERGRERSQRWAARTLDLDLLIFGEEVREGEFLTLPHPRMMERAFVLAPLCEVTRLAYRDDVWRHPVTNVNACETLATLSVEGVTRTDLAWT